MFHLAIRFCIRPNTDIEKVTLQTQIFPNGTIIFRLGKFKEGVSVRHWKRNPRAER